jgi:hypothetical protein
VWGDTTSTTSKRESSVLTEGEGGKDIGVGGYHEHDVEAGEQRPGQARADGQRHGTVVGVLHVHHREDGALGLERGHQPGLGDADGLLFHRLVDHHLVRLLLAHGGGTHYLSQ